jgi:hypothetical protein
MRVFNAQTRCLAPRETEEVLSYRPMAWGRGSLPSTESSILISFETDLP